MARLEAVHFSPAYPKAPKETLAAASERSASSITTYGFLPPISSWTFLPTALLWMPRPTLVEPVNERPLTRGSVTRASPTAPPGPVTMLRTPSGRPASVRMRTRAAAFREALPAGFMTMVLPQIRAGAIFQAGMASGKFHGVMRPTTPRGSLMELWLTPGRAEGGLMPSRRQPSDP